MRFDQWVDLSSDFLKTSEKYVESRVAVSNLRPSVSAEVVQKVVLNRFLTKYLLGFDCVSISESSTRLLTASTKRASLTCIERSYPQPLRQFPNSTFWRQLGVPQEEFQSSLVLSRLLFRQNNVCGVGGLVHHPGSGSAFSCRKSQFCLHTVARGHPHGCLHVQGCSQNIELVDQPDCHLQFNHDLPMSKGAQSRSSALRSFGVQGCDAEFAISHVTRSR